MGKKKSIPKMINTARSGSGGQAGQTLTRRLTWSTTGSSNVGGRVRTTDVTSASEWSSAAAIYSEFRVLAIRCVFAPRQLSAIAGTVSAQRAADYLITGIDRSGALAVPATALAAWGLQGARVHCLSDTISQVEARAVDLEDQLFSPVTTVPANFAVQWFYTTGFTTTAVDVLVEFIVEFRGLTG